LQRRQGTQPRLSDDRAVAGIRANIQGLFKSLGARSKKCSCGAEIWFVVQYSSERGRVVSTPYTADALNHFVDCPDRDRFRKHAGGRPAQKTMSPRVPPAAGEGG